MPVNGVHLFLNRRWHGLVGWRTLFWRDLLLAGTLLSATATLTALILLTRGHDDSRHFRCNYLSHLMR